MIDCQHRESYAHGGRVYCWRCGAEWRGHAAVRLARQAGLHDANSPTPVPLRREQPTRSPAFSIAEKVLTMVMLGTALSEIIAHDNLRVLPMVIIIVVVLIQRWRTRP